MYRFIFGAAGTGKTTYIYNWITEEAIRNPDRKYYLFVPEQNTLKAQQELIRHSPRHGMLNLDVLSFNLLAFRVFEELGYEIPEILNEMSKSLFIRKACQEVKEELKVYKNKLGTAGFIHQIKTIITEFYQYNVDKEKFDNILQSEELNPLLRGKLEDISLISEAFLKLLGDKAMIAEELPVMLLKQLHRSEIVKDAVIVFDGFTGFTPIQLELLSHIMKDAGESAFSVTIPYSANPYKREQGRNAIADLWWLSKETVAKICNVADKNNIIKAEDIIFDKKFISPEIYILKADHPEDEVKKISADIVNKSRQKDGREVRYKHIAVALTDPDGYRELIRRNFADAEISYFIDDNSTGIGNPSVELVRSVLAIIKDGYDYDDVLRYAKNALSLHLGVDEEVYHYCQYQADAMDNYVRAKGIRGRRAYEKEWNNTYRGAQNLNLELLNKYKYELLGPVFNLQDKLKSAETISGKVKCINEFIAELELGLANECLTEYLESMRYLREARENKEFYEMLSGLLESMSKLLGDEMMSLEQFIELFEAGAAELKAGILPQTLDTAIVGDLKRSRFDDIEVLYIAGANEGFLPQIASGGGIFTDQERAMLRTVDMELAPLDSEDICIQNYYLYLLMNKPVKELIISYSSTNRDGMSLKPASVIKELRSGNSKIRDKQISDEDSIYSKNEALLYYSKIMENPSADKSRAMAMYSILKDDEETQIRANRILRSSMYTHEEDKISEEEARMLYGDKLYGSVTRIEAYEKCAYAHFLTYGLRLLERQQYDIEAFDIGNLYHQAIEEVFKETAKSGRLLQDIGEEELAEMSELAVDRVISEYNDQIMQSTARNMYIGMMVKKITGRTLWAIREQLVKGTFKTMGCEIPFSIKEPNLELRGRIDRVDVAEGESEIYIKVIDYKSGRTSFDLSLIYQGIQLQLVTYMDIAIKEMERSRGKAADLQKKTVPGGMFYYRVTNPILDIKDINKSKNKTQEELMLDKFTPDGLANVSEEAVAAFDSEPTKDTVRYTGKNSVDEKAFSYLMKHTGKIIREDADKILSGDINKKPYMTGDKTGCDYCRYHSICGFDERMEGFEYRRIYKLDEKEIIDRLKKEYGEDDINNSEEQELKDEMD